MPTWEKYKLGEIAGLVKESTNPTNGRVEKYIGLEHIGQGTFLLESIGSSDDVTSNKYKFKENDILYGKLRPYFKKVYKPKFNGICSTDIFVIRTQDPTIVEQNYLYQIIRDNRFTEKAMEANKGTRMPRADWDYISNWGIDIPSLPTQHHIAEILSVLDDKIELNMQMNKTLEEIAMALYKHWFVDFGPFKDDEFVDSELGKIPKGWEVVSIKDIIDRVFDNRGKTPPLDTMFKNHLLLETYQMSRDNLFPSDTQLNKAKFVSTEIYKTWFRKGHPEYLDILFATVGNGIPNWSFMPKNTGYYCIAQNVIAFRTNERSSQFFLRFCFETNSFLSQFNGYIISTAQPSIKLNDIYRIKIVIPNKEVINKYDSVVKDMINQSYLNICENQTLKQTRDYLLPKLISGDVKVNVDEKGIKEIA